ncbi:unnamed protein product [Pedinophyceae sp. YPF-701]|nr:unnamed protein product [Pedinophyceae sp. YPF-701]
MTGRRERNLPEKSRMLDVARSRQKNLATERISAGPRRATMERRGVPSVGLPHMYWEPALVYDASRTGVARLQPAHAVTAAEGVFWHDSSTAYLHSVHQSAAGGFHQPDACAELYGHQAQLAVAGGGNQELMDLEEGGIDWDLVEDGCAATQAAWWAYDLDEHLFDPFRTDSAEEGTYSGADRQAKVASWAMQAEVDPDHPAFQNLHPDASCFDAVVGAMSPDAQAEYIACSGNGIGLGTPGCNKLSDITDNPLAPATGNDGQAAALRTAAKPDGDGPVGPRVLLPAPAPAPAAELKAKPKGKPGRGARACAAEARGGGAKPEGGKAGPAAPALKPATPALKRAPTKKRAPAKKAGKRKDGPVKIGHRNMPVLVGGHAETLSANSFMKGHYALFGIETEEGTPFNPKELYDQKWRIGHEEFLGARLCHGLRKADDAELKRRGLGFFVQLRNGEVRWTEAAKKKWFKRDGRNAWKGPHDDVLKCMEAHGETWPGLDPSAMTEDLKIKLCMYFTQRKGATRDMPLSEGAARKVLKQLRDDPPKKKNQT